MSLRENAALLLLIVLSLCIHSCDTEPPVESHQVEFIESEPQGFKFNRLIIKGVEGEEVTTLVDDETVIAQRVASDTFSIFLPADGIVAFQVPELNFTTEVSIKRVSLGTQMPEEVFIDVTNKFDIGENIEPADKAALEEAFEKSVNTFESYSQEEKEMVAKFLKANEEEINLLANVGRVAPNGRIKGQACVDLQGNERLKCLIPIFLEDVALMGTSSVLAAAAAGSGFGALVGGAIAGTITLPAFYSAKKNLKEIFNTTGVIVEVAGYEIISARKGSFALSGNQVTLEFKYQLRTLDSSDENSNDSLLVDAVKSINSFRNMWNKYVGSLLDLEIDYIESYSTVSASQTSMSSEVTDNSGIIIAEAVSVGDSVTLTLDIPENATATSVNIELSDENVFKTYEVALPEQDCNGEFGGTAFTDDCGQCVGGNTGNEACVADCSGVFGGTAYIDNCGQCVGGNTGKEACAVDCNGDINGSAVLDSCGQCVGGNTNKQPCDLKNQLVNAHAWYFSITTNFPECNDVTDVANRTIHFLEDGTIFYEMEVVSSSYTITDSTLDFSYTTRHPIEHEKYDYSYQKFVFVGFANLSEDNGGQVLTLVGELEWTQWTDSQYKCISNPKEVVIDNDWTN